jgi:hypothetical protein
MNPLFLFLPFSQQQQQQKSFSRSLLPTFTLTIAFLCTHHHHWREFVVAFFEPKGTCLKAQSEEVAQEVDQFLSISTVVVWTTWEQLPILLTPNFPKNKC